MVLGDNYRGRRSITLVKRPADVLIILISKTVIITINATAKQKDTTANNTAIAATSKLVLKESSSVE